MPVQKATPSAHSDTFTRDALPPREAWPDLVFDLPELQYPERLNCAVELLDRVVDRLGGDRPCLVDGVGGVWSYEDLRRISDQVARVLAEDLAVRPGERVLLRGPNNPWLVACWLGVLKAGAVVVTTMPLLRSGELRTICDIARVRVALSDSRFAEDLVAAGVEGLRMMEYGGPGGDDLVQLAATKPETFASVDTAADDVCLLAFTSGTTGRPKATMHFHRDVLAIADTFSRHVVKPEPTDVFAGSPPLAFTFGLGGLVVFPLRVGASTVLLERASPVELFQAVGRHRVSVLYTAPTAYRAALGHLEDYDLSSLRRCVSAGEALPKSTWQGFYDATGVALIDGIGATEMLHIFIASCDEEIRPGSTGRPVPGYTACIVDEHGAPVPDGEPGLLAVKGPTGCRYLADDRQAAYVRDGWNLTGDVFVRDADGYFWYQARADDMIVSSGYNIAGPEVERALLAHPDVLECAVVGAPDPDRGMVVTAFVVLAPDVPPTPDTVQLLQNFVKTQIAPYKYPRVVRFLEVLPKTSTGKLQRFPLRELAAQQT
ncbi:MAG TPA: AMP-binding protein [Mycobacteriales bacterium]|nr:AMP-binding protein [Mycobacteriales bacterium]